MHIPPLDLIQQPKPFSHPDWLFEVKHDGYRAVAYVENGNCKLLSRKDYTYTRFKDVADNLSKLPDCVLDGELVCLDKEGKTRFYDLMFNRKTVYFYAFDIMWMDADLRDEPLVERKKILLQKVCGDAPSQLLYVDYIEENGKDLYEMICARDMEGIVAKPKESPYRMLKGQTPWIKIKNPDYSQAEGCSELFNQKR